MNKGLKNLCILATVVSVGLGGYKVYKSYAKPNSSEDKAKSVSMTDKTSTYKPSYSGDEVATEEEDSEEDTDITDNDIEVSESDNAEEVSKNQESQNTQSTESTSKNQENVQESSTVQSQSVAVESIENKETSTATNSVNTQSTTTPNNTNIFKNIKNYNVYYGTDYSDEIINKMANYDVMILTPTSVPDTDTLRKIQNKGVKVYAYVTFGEISRTDNEILSSLSESDYLHIDNSRVQNYGCDLADIRSENYKKLMMSIIQKRVASAGYDGLFIDTLDDYEFTSVLKTQELVDEMTTEAASLIKRIHTEFPTLSLIVNRAFTAVEKCDQRYADALLYECIHVDENDGYFQKLVKSVDDFTAKGGVCLSLATEPEQEQLGTQKAKEKGWVHYYRPDEDYSTWYDYFNN